MRCAVLEQTIGEAPVDAPTSRQTFPALQGAVLKGAFEFKSTTTDILRAFAEQAIFEPASTAVPTFSIF